MTNDRLGQTTPKTPEAPYYVKGLALGLPAYLIGIHLWTWVFYLPVFLAGGADFCRLYTAGYMAWSGNAKLLYDAASEAQFQHQLVNPESLALPFNHPAYEALLFAPLSVLPYRAAYFVFLTCNVALLAVSFRMLRPRMNALAGVFPWLPAAMFLAFLPIAAALIQGQDSILLLTLLAAAAVALERDREVTAGVLVGLGFFKFQIVLPIALLFLVWRRWRFAGGFAFSSAIVAALSLWLVGLAETAAYIHSIASTSVFSSGEALSRNGIDPLRMANLRGLVFGLAGQRSPASWVQGITLALSGIVFIAVAVLFPRKRQGMDAFLVAITASALVSYHSLIHDMSVLLIPVVLVLSRYIPAEATGDLLGRRAVLAAALMFVAPVCVSFAPYHFYLVSLPLCAFLVVLMERGRSDEASNKPGGQLAA